MPPHAEPVLAAFLPVAGGLLVLVLLVSGCSGPEASTQAQSAAPAGVEVATAEVTVRSLGAELETVGTAAANESVDVTSEVAKKVTAIRFDEGDFVRAGTVLVELDSDEAKASVSEAEAAVTDSGSRLRRSQDLFTRQALSEAELDQLSSTHKANQARLEAARARLADTVIRAGFDGRTGFRRVSIGTLVGPNTVITTLDDVSVIKLNFTVPETSFAMIKKGLPITAVSVALPNRKFQGQITELDSRVDPITRSITVRAQLPNPDGALRPGMFMTVSLQGEVMPVLVVPKPRSCRSRETPTSSSSRMRSRSDARYTSGGAAPARCRSAPAWKRASSWSSKGRRICATKRLCGTDPPPRLPRPEPCGSRKSPFDGRCLPRSSACC